jgi:polyisoprenoid-binding protein YceI
VTTARRARRWRWAVIGVAALAVAAVAGPWLYINVLQDDPPPPLSAAASPSSTAATGTAAGGTVEGTWNAGGGSQAGYRVKEVLLGQDNDAVGRTSAVTGQLTIQGASVTAARFTVDLTSVQSDESRRDQQFQGRIMETATYPTATFELGAPIQLGSVPADGVGVTAKASGDLTLHGTTRPVSFDVTAQRSGATIRASGQIPVTFADYGIPDPSFGPVSTEDHGQVEFLLVLEHA